MDRLSITITGRLGSDPRLSETASGKPRLHLSVAVDDSRGRDDRPPVWFSVKAFGLLAERTAASVRKGDMVTVRGDGLETWVFEDRQQPGEYRAGVAITAYDIAASMRFDSLVTGRSVRAEAQPGAGGPVSPETGDGDRASLSVIDGARA